MINEKVDHVLSVGMVRGEQMGGRKIQVRSIRGQSCGEGTWAAGGWAAGQGKWEETKAGLGQAMVSKTQN